MAETTTTAVQPRKDIGELVIGRLNDLAEKSGMIFPKDYNYVNAIKASMLAIAEAKDRNGRPALEVCTPSSIQSALFKMATMGLDISKNQAYAIVYNDKLNLQESYFGKILRAKRLYPNWTPVGRVIREGDVFEFGILPDSGKRYVIKHESNLENIDNKFIGAYVYIPCSDGTNELFIMTERQIRAAWAKSQNKSQTTHKEFEEKMVLKTLYSSACTTIINSTPSTASYESIDDTDPIDETPISDYEEVNDPMSALPQSIENNATETIEQIDTDF